MDKSKAVLVAVAIIFALVVVAIIKFLLVSINVRDLTERDLILGFEVAALGAILAAFILTEVIHLARIVIGDQQHESENQSSEAAQKISPFTIVICFSASVAIFLAASTWIKHFLT